MPTVPWSNVDTLCRWRSHSNPAKVVLWVPQGCVCIMLIEGWRTRACSVQCAYSALHGCGTRTDVAKRVARILIDVKHGNHRWHGGPWIAPAWRVVAKPLFYSWQPKRKPTTPFSFFLFMNERKRQYHPVGASAILIFDCYVCVAKMIRLLSI